MSGRNSSVPGSPCPVITGFSPVLPSPGRVKPLSPQRPLLSDQLATQQALKFARLGPVVYLYLPDPRRPFLIPKVAFLSTILTLSGDLAKTPRGAYVRGWLSLCDGLLFQCDELKGRRGAQQEVNPHSTYLSAHPFDPTRLPLAVARCARTPYAPLRFAALSSARRLAACTAERSLRSLTAVMNSFARAPCCASGAARRGSLSTPGPWVSAVIPVGRVPQGCVLMLLRFATRAEQLASSLSMLRPWFWHAVFERGGVLARSV